MNAVFLEDEIGWDKHSNQAVCSLTIYNYTARARAYTILAKWPEGEGVAIAENPRGGRKETTGLWAWRLDTLDPGQSTEIRFTVSGLSKGDWTDAEIFFRGNGDIIGATKIDEKLLDEMRKMEALALAEAEYAAATMNESIQRLVGRTPLLETSGESLVVSSDESVADPSDESVAEPSDEPQRIIDNPEDLRQWTPAEEVNE
jgi:hypothetical protein